MSATVYTGGTFDLIHPGHVDFLARCAKLADGGRVVVSLNDDGFVASYKGRPPVMCYADRRLVLLGLRSVNDVVLNRGGADSRPTILEVRPDWVAIGEDWAHRDYYAQMQFTPEWLDRHGIDLVYLPLLPGYSSTVLRAAA